MILLQLSEVSGRLVWQELFACLAIFQFGFLAAAVGWVIWRAIRTVSEVHDLDRLKREEKRNAGY